MLPNNKVFDVNEMNDYFVNGSPTKSSITPLQNVTNGMQLNTRGLPPPINRVIAGFGAATQQPSTSQRLNVQTKKVDKSWRKNIPHMVFNNNCLVAKKTYPIQLNEKCANVAHVANELKIQVNMQNPILIDSFNLEIGDSNLTRGSSFWKGSRKIMVIEEDCLQRFNEQKCDSKSTRGARAKRRVIDLEDDEEEDFEDTESDDISYSPISSQNVTSSLNAINQEIISLLPSI